MSSTTLHFESFEAFSPFSDIGPYRAADYWQLPEKAPVELLRGRFIKSPKRSVLHQITVGQLGLSFYHTARESGGRGFFGPLDCTLADHTIVQPDVLYISRSRRSIIKDRVQSAPDIAVEVVEPNTVLRDRIETLDLYAMYDVPEYWIVDPQSQHFDFLLNEGGRFVMQTPIADRYQSSRLPEVELDLAAFWREVDARMWSK